RGSSVEGAGEGAGRGGGGLARPAGAAQGVLSPPTASPPAAGPPYQSHRVLSASTRTRPRPLSASSSGLMRIGGSGLASHTRTSTLARSDSSHIRTGEGQSSDRGADTPLVTSSATTQSTVPLSGVSRHSQTIWRA